MEHAGKQQARPIRIGNKRLKKPAAENKDDNLKPRSVLNKYRHAIDLLSALALGCSLARYLERERRCFSPALAFPSGTQ